MTKAQHTPGPWEAKDKTEKFGYFSIEGDGLILGRITYHASKREDFTLKEEAQANARLIATAPKLLEACKMAEQYLRDTHFAPTLYDIIHAAIAESKVK